MRRFALILGVALAALLSLAGSALGASFAANPGSLGAIPDGTTPLSCARNYGPPRDVTFDAGGLSGTISDVQVSFTLNPADSWVGDLRVELLAPSGQSQTIFSYTGNPPACGDGSYAAGPYTFSDAAPASPSWWEAAAATPDRIVAPDPIPSGSYRASTPGEEPGGGANTLITPAFTAASPNGVWTLRFRDGAQPDTGTVSAATLSIDAPPATCKGKPATIVGTNGTDVRKGTARKDVILGLGGNDKLSGLAGNDVICGGPGKDTLKGGQGNDKLYGDSGKDTLKGGPGKDKLKGGAGKDKQLQ